jgi:hypothetical protein
LYPLEIVAGIRSLRLAFSFAFKTNVKSL